MGVVGRIVKAPGNTINFLTKGETGKEGLKNAARRLGVLGVGAACIVAGFKGAADGVERGLEHYPPVVSTDTTLDTTEPSVIKEIDVYFGKICDTMTKIGSGASLSTQSQFFGKDIPGYNEMTTVELNTDYSICYGDATIPVTMELNQEEATFTVDIQSSSITADAVPEVLSTVTRNQNGNLKTLVDSGSETGAVIAEGFWGATEWVGDLTNSQWLSEAGENEIQALEMRAEAIAKAGSDRVNYATVIAMQNGWEECGRESMDVVKYFIGNTAKDTIMSGLQAASEIDERLADPEVIVTIDGRDVKYYTGVPPTSIKADYDKVMKWLAAAPDGSFKVVEDSKPSCVVPPHIKKLAVRADQSEPGSQPVNSSIAQGDSYE